MKTYYDVNDEIEINEMKTARWNREQKDENKNRIRKNTEETWLYKYLFIYLINTKTKKRTLKNPYCDAAQAKSEAA